jgi:hypothetical protein
VTGRRVAAMLLALLAAAAGLVGGRGAGGHAPPVGGRCHVGGSGDLIRPDDRCTPGTFDALSRAAACRHKERPSLPVAERRRIARRYGYGSWSGRDGELDHRVPFFLGGRTEAGNLWPEAGRIPNRKDRLERAVYERVCVAGSMTVAEARAVFLGDWTRVG